MDVGRSHAGRLLSDKRIIEKELASSEQELKVPLETKIGERRITRLELGDIPEWLERISMDK